MSSLLRTIPRLTKNSRVPSFSGSLPSVETSWEIQLSDLVFGEIIASGSFGTVYKGEYIGTECAIKKIFRNVMEEQDMRKFLERELAASKFSHPNIVGFIGIAESEEEQALYLVTELMHTSLHAILRDMSDPLPWKRRVRLLLSGAKSLGYLHAKNIIHRDIKSRNLLIDDSGKLKICDFGFARKVVRGTKSMMTICGTDEYMAPEVILGDPYNDSADVYSFGVVICEVITRKSVKKTFPREPRNLFAFDFDKFKEEVTSDCPTELSDICVKCLATESDERPSFANIISTLAEIDRNLHLASPLSAPQISPDHGDFSRSVSTPKILITDNSNNNNDATKLAQSDNLQEAMVSFRARSKSDSPSKKKLPGSIQDSNMDNLALQNLNLKFAFQEELDEITSNYFKSSKSLSGWVTLGYENDNTLEIQGHGSGGVDELLDSLANNQVQYSLLRLSYVSQDNIQKVRDVFIYWTGPNVSVVQRGKKKTHVGAVQQILKPFHADLLAYNKDNFTEEIILERSSPLSGSHVIE